MLTEKEQRILDYISQSLKTKGYAPTVRDIRSALGIKSTATVFSYIERLEKKGVLIRESGKSRTLRLGDVDEDGSGTGAAVSGSMRIPILGRVRAGLPILAEENLDGYVDFTPARHIDSALFALRVVGTSMIEAGILDGDIVIVESASTADEGEMIVALIDDSATVKMFYREGNMFRLEPRNKAMQPIYTKELSVLGRVVASVRYY